MAFDWVEMSDSAVGHGLHMAWVCIGTVRDIVAFILFGSVKNKVITKHGGDSSCTQDNPPFWRKRSPSHYLTTK